MSEEKKFTSEISCAHCKNVAPMEIVAYFDNKKPDFIEEIRQKLDAGTMYELVKCPACKGIMLTKQDYHELDDYQTMHVVLFPPETSQPKGLPTEIQDAYEAGLRVRSIDANAYAVLIGRVLEMVCIDRKAKGDDLNSKLLDLSKKGEIPGTLVKIAHSLRYLRNIGAHVTLGEIKKIDIPTLDALCRAILEYIYSAPYLVAQVEKCLRKYQTKKKK